MKTGSNFFQVWGGISGIQHTLPLLITEGHVNRQLALPFLSRLLTFNVASRFALPPAKGRIEPGADADLALVNLQGALEVTEDSLLYRHRQTPYLRRKLNGKVVRTFMRGRTVFLDGKIASAPLGRLVKC